MTTKETLSVVAAYGNSSVLWPCLFIWVPVLGTLLYTCTKSIGDLSKVKHCP
jgi:hypothetical protein